MEPKETETAGGAGPGITGASGDIIEGTGHNQGVGGTGHDNDADAARHAAAGLNTRPAPTRGSQKGTRHEGAELHDRLSGSACGERRSGGWVRTQSPRAVTPEVRGSAGWRAAPAPSVTSSHHGAAARFGGIGCAVSRLDQTRRFARRQHEREQARVLGVTDVGQLRSA